MIRQLVRNQLNEQNSAKPYNNGVFLESKTFNMVLLYILMKETLGTSGEIGAFTETSILEKLEQEIADNKKEFEEVITLIKEKL